MRFTTGFWSVRLVLSKDELDFIRTKGIADDLRTGGYNVEYSEGVVEVLLFSSPKWERQMKIQNAVIDITKAITKQLKVAKAVDETEL